MRIIPHTTKSRAQGAALRCWEKREVRSRKVANLVSLCRGGRAGIRFGLVKCDGERHALTRAVKRDLCGIARGVASDGGLEVGITLNVLVIDLGDYIAGLYTGRLCAASVLHTGDHRADGPAVIVGVHGVIIVAQRDAHI